MADIIWDRFCAALDGDITVVLIGTRRASRTARRLAVASTSGPAEA